MDADPRKKSPGMPPIVKNNTDLIPDVKITEVEVDKEVEKRAAIMAEIDYSIYDKKNPNSLINRCDTRTSLLISKIPERWHFVTESKIVELAAPEDREVRLRLAFWQEYNRACRTDEKMSRARICYGICSVEVWKKYILTDWKKMCFIVRPPRQEMFLHKTLLMHGYDRIAEILKMPIQNQINKCTKEELPTGKTKAHTIRYMKVDTVAIRAIRDTVKMLISTQSMYHLAATFGKGGGKKKKPEYPDQDLPPVADDLPDPNELADEVDELENILEREAEDEFEDEVDADIKEVEEDELKAERKSKQKKSKF